MQTDHSFKMSAIIQPQDRPDVSLRIVAQSSDGCIAKFELRTLPVRLVGYPHHNIQRLVEGATMGNDQIPCWRHVQQLMNGLTSPQIKFKITLTCLADIIIRRKEIGFWLFLVSHLMLQSP